MMIFHCKLLVHQRVSHNPPGINGYNLTVQTCSKALRGAQGIRALERGRVPRARRHVGDLPTGLGGVSPARSDGWVFPVANPLGKPRRCGDFAWILPCFPKQNGGFTWDDIRFPDKFSCCFWFYGTVLFCYSWISWVLVNVVNPVHIQAVTGLIVAYSMPGFYLGFRMM